MTLRDQSKAGEAAVQFRLALAMEEARQRLDDPLTFAGTIPPHDARPFGLAIKLRQILAGDAKPEEALALYRANEAVANLLGPGGRATQMFSAMVPEPGAPDIPVPAPVNMATLLAESCTGAGKALQAMGRNQEAMAEFAAATTYGPKPGIPNVIGRTGNRQDSNFAGNAHGGQTAEAYMELAKNAIRRRDYRAAAAYMSQATNIGIPRDRMQEANDIQMQIARGMRGW
jgi:hypothetical protein